MITVLLLFLPLAAALIIFALRSQAAKHLALTAALVELGLSLFVAMNFTKDASVQYDVSIPWIRSIGLQFAVGIDGISMLLILLTTVLVPFIILSSYRHDYSKPWTFYGLILTMQMALIGVFIARDGLLFYLFWEVALIPIYFICLIWGGEDRGRITFKFFVYTLGGSLLMLVALMYLYYRTPGSHSFDIQSLYAAGASLPLNEQCFVFWGLFVAFAIKMPVFPFHTWQPDTYTVAPTQGTMLLSGIMLKMGIFGVIRWLLPVVPLGVAEWGFTAVILSVIGIIYASCIAIIQKDVKRLIAYSSIAHVGLIAGGVFTLSQNGLQGAMIQMFSHGILVVALFFIIDVISSRTQSRNLADLGGIRNSAPQLTTIFVIIMLGSVALPLTSGFVGEFLLINSLYNYKAAIGAVAGLTIILGAVYMLKAFQRSMSGEPNAKTAQFQDLTTQEKLVLYPIALLVLIIGIYPAPLMDISEAAVTNLVNLYSNYSASIK